MGQTRALYRGKVIVRVEEGYMVDEVIYDTFEEAIAAAEAE